MDEITAAVLGAFRDVSALSRRELVAASGFARATVENRLERLLAAGLIVPDAPARRTGGRPAERLTLNARRGALLVADVGGSHTRVAVFDLSGALLEVHDHVMDINLGPEAVLGLLADEFDALCATNGFERDGVAGIAIGMPGPVEHASGRIVRPPTMRGWDGTDVPAFFAGRFTAPVAVDKDANLIAVGEYYALDHRPEDMVLLKMGMGIGGGVIARGRILRGAQGAAGDLGHLPQRGGARCRCGQEGCAEATAGGWVIAETLRRNGFPQVHTSHDIVRLARSGEALVHELLRQAGRRLGEMLVEVIGVLNPSTIIVGGNLAPASEDLLFSLRERVRELSHPLAVRDLRIVLGSLGPDAGILGASRLAAETAFDGPVIAGLIAHT